MWLISYLSYFPQFIFSSVKLERCHTSDLFYKKKGTILIFKKTTACGGQSFKVYASLAAIINQFPSGSI